MKIFQSIIIIPKKGGNINNHLIQLFTNKVNEIVIGYVTCSMSKIFVSIDDLDVSTHPALLLGRMGLDKAFKKKELVKI